MMLSATWPNAAKEKGKQKRQKKGEEEIRLREREAIKSKIEGKNGEDEGKG